MDGSLVVIMKASSASPKGPNQHSRARSGMRLLESDKPKNTSLSTRRVLRKHTFFWKDASTLMSAGPFFF